MEKRRKKTEMKIWFMMPKKKTRQERELPTTIKEIKREFKRKIKKKCEIIKKKKLKKKKEKGLTALTLKHLKKKKKRKNM